MDYRPDLKLAQDRKKVNRIFLNKLRKERPTNLDDNFHRLHEETFQDIDCLKCANCCKTTSPIFERSDIDRLAKSLKMKAGEFIHEYLDLDDDRDYVLKHAPCPFLGHDNRCIVYESRPKACREYPHTNRKRMYQIMDLTYHNTLVCPAVSRIVSRLQELDN